MSLILLAVGVPNKEITKLTGLCDKSVRVLKKQAETGELESLFLVSGGGRKSKLKDLESAISEAVEQDNYHSRQQIADMILEKYGIKISVWTVGKLLKKRD